MNAGFPKAKQKIDSVGRRLEATGARRAVMQLLETAALYVGANLLILLILSVLVVAGRQKHKIVLGDGENAVFSRAVRAHANAAEYIPGALIGLVTLALFDPATPAWLLHAAGLSLT